VIDGAAQYEHGLIRARTTAALAAKRARGERVGSVPFGFALHADGVRLVANLRERATIARARRLRAQGLSLRMVVARLANEGRVSRTGRRFTAEQVARMLSRRAPPLLDSSGAELVSLRLCVKSTSPSSMSCAPTRASRRLRR
jgi:DNA invertase Pin-like site-specific DNA recombinase